LAFAVVGTIAAAAPGQSQIKPSAWTWQPTPRGPASPGTSNSAAVSAAQSGPSGTTLTGPSGNHVVLGQSSKNDTSGPLRNMATPFTPSTKQQTIPVLPLPKSTTTPRTTTSGHVQTKLGAAKMPGALLNFEGIEFPGVNCDCAPPDTNGAAGDTQ